MDCDTPNRPYLIGINTIEKKAVLFQPRCGLWSCPSCAEKNRARWAVRAYHGTQLLLQGKADVDFLTLTSHEKLSVAGSLEVFHHAWDQLNKRVRRASPNYAYILIPERHKSGKLHAHLIETCGQSTTWFKKNARSCGLGYMAKVRHITEPELAAWYVTKYVTKTLQDETWPRGWRRVRTSRNWPPMPILPADENWTFSVLSRLEALDETIAKYESAGFEVARLGSGTAWDYVSGALKLDT